MSYLASCEAMDMRCILKGTLFGKEDIDKSWYDLPPAIKTLPFPNLLAIRKLTLHHLSISTSFPKQNHLLIRRVTNHITEGDVTSIRSLISQERSDCIFARSDFIDIVQVCASSSEVEHPWYLCIPHRRSFFREYSFSTITRL